MNGSPLKGRSLKEKDSRPRFYGEKKMNGKVKFDNTVSLLNSLPALTFSKDAETGRYLACS